MAQVLVVLTKDNIAEYGMAHPKQFDPAWKQRDFVSKVSGFMHYRSGGIKIVSGLRGMGKTVGLMQTIEHNDALYLRCIEKGSASIDEILGIIRSYPEKSNVIIDEFTWLKEFLPPVTDDDYAKRNDAERLIVALSESGKNMILTGDEPVSLEAAKSRGFMHKAADTLHVTRFSFAEFKRIFKDCLPPETWMAYDVFLRDGGVFEKRAKLSIRGIDDCIRDSIAGDLHASIENGNGLPCRQVMSVVYEVLLGAVHDTVGPAIPKEEFIERAKASLAAAGIPDVTEKPCLEAVQKISETLESIGVIIKIPNAIPGQNNFDDEDARTYIVNPAISNQLAKIALGNIDKESDVLSRLMEAAVIVELDAEKMPGNKVYFYDLGGMEVGAVIAPISGEEPVSLIGIRHGHGISASDIQTILSDDIEKAISERFPDNDIENRYIVYTGPRKIEVNPNNERTYLFVGIDDCLQRYWDFDGNMDLIQKEVNGNHC